MTMTSIVRAAGILGLILNCTGSPGFAQDAGCDKFAWPLTHERALFAATDKRALAAGAELAAFPKEAIALSLKPAAQATFVLAPERKSKLENWFGGTVRFPAPEKPGSYQVTLSQEAWIDVVQNGRYARSTGSTGRSDCSGMRKSVRFELDATPFAIQLSGVAAESIDVAISRGN
jgi:hypothetical protein